MKKRLKLRPYVLPSIYLVLVTMIILTAMTKFEDNPNSVDGLTYVSSVILSNDTPVISTDEVVIIKPYLNETVKVGRNFYNYKDEEKNQQNSIVYYENTYIQNSGIDYVADEVFDVVSVLEGTILSVNNNDILGNIIEIKHDNNYISVYQGLSSVLLKEGDVVKQGQTIGKSGKSKINKDLGNHLHFELFKDGKIVNPEKLYNKKINE